MPIEGRIDDHLKNDDHVVCDVDSLDIWLKLNISIDSSFKSLDSTVEIKVDKEVLGSDLMDIIQKLCIQIWN